MAKPQGQYTYNELSDLRPGTPAHPAGAESQH